MEKLPGLERSSVAASTTLTALPVYDSLATPSTKRHRHAATRRRTRSGEHASFLGRLSAASAALVDDPHNPCAGDLHAALGGRAGSSGLAVLYGIKEGSAGGWPEIAKRSPKITKGPRRVLPINSFGGIVFEDSHRGRVRARNGQVPCRAVPGPLLARGSRSGKPGAHLGRGRRG